MLPINGLVEPFIKLDEMGVMVEHIVQTHIYKSKYDYRLLCSSLYGCVLRSNINPYNLSPNGIEHNREPLNSV